ncbi:MAG TPA: flagellar export chaperone FliS [Burkholderiaceae bacterium]
MFTSAYAPSTFGRAQGFAQAYARIGAETSVNSASAHHLITLLFNGFIDSVTLARGAMREGRIEAKGKAIGRAARIVEEGLKAGLNMQEGGKLAADLSALYAYVALRLTVANLRNDESALDECVRLINPLREAWISIGPQVEAGNL